MKLLLLFILSSITLLASEEEMLRWENFQIGFGTRPETGEIKLSGTMGRSGYQELSVFCFGEKRIVPSEIRGQLNLFFPRSIMGSHEGGYEILGGHTVHFRFYRNTTDGEGKLKREEAILSIPKNSKMSLSIQELKG